MSKRNIIEVKPENKWTEVKYKKNNIQKLLEIDSVKRKNTTNLYKTRFCNNTFCKKIDCDFAHSIEEINTIDCFHKERCRQVFEKDGILKNKSSLNFCKYKHPNETKEQYLYRVGYVKKQIIEIKTTKEDVHKDIDKMLENGAEKFMISII